MECIQVSWGLAIKLNLRPWEKTGRLSATSMERKTAFLIES
jgi:hypothetical protein